MNKHSPIKQLVSAIMGANLVATGDCKKFELQNLGQIRIAGNGEWNLTIRADPSA